MIRQHTRVLTNGTSNLALAALITTSRLKKKRHEAGENPKEKSGRGRRAFAEFSRGVSRGDGKTRFSVQYIKEIRVSGRIARATLLGVVHPPLPLPSPSPMSNVNHRRYPRSTGKPPGEIT